MISDSPSVSNSQQPVAHIRNFLLPAFPIKDPLECCCELCGVGLQAKALLHSFAKVRGKLRRFSCFDVQRLQLPQQISPTEKPGEMNLLT